MVLPHTLHSCLLSHPFPSHHLGSLLLSNIAAPSETVTHSSLGLHLQLPSTHVQTHIPPGHVHPKWTWTHILRAFVYLCGAVYSTPQRAVLCVTTVETFSWGTASDASQEELAGLGTRTFAPWSKLPPHLVLLFFCHLRWEQWELFAWQNCLIKWTTSELGLSFKTGWWICGTNTECNVMHLQDQCLYLPGSKYKELCSCPARGVCASLCPRCTSTCWAEKVFLVEVFTWGEGKQVAAFFVLGVRTNQLVMLAVVSKCDFWARGEWKK